MDYMRKHRMENGGSGEVEDKRRMTMNIEEVGDERCEDEGGERK